ncbi:hypothetical protein GUJ93_ZPchr0009g424 [Zizania palustris]|uniref:Uncharacterized protein n=1 Tax=Zizania palustris TaxID=103762 RepID=A0A8J5RYM2_ZIZPA|nr:hypothetical protein GUJ93_ZPchr0009g424 [Zizania palustris]
MKETSAEAWAEEAEPTQAVRADPTEQVESWAKLAGVARAVQPSAEARPRAAQLRATDMLAMPRRCGIGAETDHGHP